MPNIMASETLNFPKVTAWEEENDDIIPTCRRVKRLAVVDGCNVIHGCAGLNPYFEHKSKKQSRKPDAIGLLIVLKRLLEEDFEVRIFISMAYMSNTNCSNFFILEELIKLNYLFVVPPRVYDDVAILHCASKLGGFVVSNDKYREFKCIPMCYEATNRVIPFTFKRLDLQEIGGKQALNNPERKFWLGMDLHLALDQYKTVCTSDIREDPNFLMIYSRRRIRPKVARDQCLRTLTVIADFLQREFCFVHQMKPPPLAYFSQSALPPAKFSTFLDHYKTLRRTQNIFVI